MQWVEIFLGIVFMKFLLNFISFVRCKLYLARYKEYLANPKWSFVEHQPAIISLFKKAGLEDGTVTVVEPLGFGYVQHREAPLFENLTARREDIVGLTIQNFHKAIGVYRSRMLEAFSPFYWLEVIVYLPRNVLVYLGVPPESVFVKIAQLFYWAFSIILGLVKEQVFVMLRDWVLAHFKP